MSFDRLDLRNALGSFATGVTIVTTNTKGDAPIGMTVNSFASLSLDPPLILWSLQNDSDCFSAFNETDYFAVNILLHNQSELAMRYAKKNQHQLDENHCQAKGQSAAPLLAACKAFFECKVETRFSGGDHQIIVGRVLNFSVKSPERPLIFYEGAFAGISQA